MDYKAVRGVLFRFGPEDAHETTKKLMRNEVLRRATSLVFGGFAYKDGILEQKLFGKSFSNPVGLAAGFDKEGNFVEAAEYLGFGHIESGTVTFKAQKGNPKPRLFRLAEQESLVNRMGFNNPGIDAFMRNVSRNRSDLPLGISIGKGKDTLMEKAIYDYIALAERVSNAGKATYLSVNLSSPNTKNLRLLQNKGFVSELFSTISSVTKIPAFIKIDPDLKTEEAVVICSRAIDNGAAGIIATNTSTDYSLVGNKFASGGISGRLITSKSRLMLNRLANEFDTKIISVGGISDSDEAYARIKNGASLVQIYTAFVYNGPTIAKTINMGIAKLLRKDGYSRIGEAIGVDLRR